LTCEEQDPRTVRGSCRVELPEETERARATLEAATGAALALLVRGALRSGIAAADVHPGEGVYVVRRWYELDGTSWEARFRMFRNSDRFDPVWWYSVWRVHGADGYSHDLGTVYLVRSDVEAIGPEEAAEAAKGGRKSLAPALDRFIDANPDLTPAKLRDLAIERELATRQGTGMVWKNGEPHELKDLKNRVEYRRKRRRNGGESPD
jgi:hypothetical protein